MVHVVGLRLPGCLALALLGLVLSQDVLGQDGKRRSVGQSRARGLPCPAPGKGALHPLCPMAATQRSF